MSDEATGGELGDEPLRCHYCGADCEMEGGDGYAYVACGNIQCNATGPNHPTPELCRDAHRRVMPAPAWTNEEPETGAATWHRCEHSESASRLVRFYDPTEVCPLNHLQSPCPLCEFAPVPRPAEPAEGGAG